MMRETALLIILAEKIVNLNWKKLKRQGSN